MKSITTTAAVVTRIGELQPSKFEGKPHRAPVDFLASDGQKMSDWFDAPDVARLAPGLPVTLIHTGKNLKLADVPAAAASPSPFPAAQPLPAASPKTASRPGNFFEVPNRELRENILKYIEWESKLYRTCYEQACEAMKEFDLDKYNTKDIATTLFLSVQRRFNLQ